MALRQLPLSRFASIDSALIAGGRATKHPGNHRPTEGHRVARAVDEGIVTGDQTLSCPGNPFDVGAPPVELMGEVER